MKRYSFLAIISLCWMSCKKSTTEPESVTTVNVINASVDLGAVKVDVTGGNTAFVYATAPAINYGASKLFYTPTLNFKVAVSPVSDSGKTVFNNTIAFNGGWYSLIITGRSPNIDTLVREETNFPFIPKDRILNTTDSVVTVRFANLSPNSSSLKVKLSTATTNEIDNLPYKSISSWKAYASLATSTSYVFQVRDANTDALLVSYTLAANASNRFKNVMLVIRGLQGTTSGTNALGISVINYF